MTDSSILSEIDSLISGLIEEEKSIGFNLAVYDNKTTHLKSYGKLAVDDETVCDPDTIFAIGSISKSFTSLAILILEQQGKLSINDPIAKYLPLNLQGKEQKILLRHLMSHSSGLPDLFICPIIEAAVGLRDDYNSLNLTVQFSSWEDIFEHISANHELITSEPGERFHYSDISFSLLQYIVTEISGLSYLNFLQQEIFTPLEMKHTTLRSEYSNQKAAYGHFSSDQSIINLRKTRPNYPGHMLVDGGGGVMASASSMINYLEYMINDGMYRSKRLISEERFQEMISPQVAVAPDRNFYYGFGWMILKDTNLGKIVVHTGHTGSVTSTMGFVPDRKFGVYHSNNYSIAPLPIFINIITKMANEPLQSKQDTPFFMKLFDFQGSYVGPLGIEKLQFSINQESAKLIMRSVGIYSVKENEFTLYNQDEQYYIVMNGMKTVVIFEEIDGNKFATVGMSVLKQNNT